MPKLNRYIVGTIFAYIFERKLKIRLPITSERRWKWNLLSEIRFWEKLIKQTKFNQNNVISSRLDPNLPLQKKIINLLPFQEEIRILDVGAGPLTYLGKCYNKSKLIIEAIDPLAEEYDYILNKYQLIQPIRTTKLDAEKIGEKYSENSFDFVFASNSLDHCYSPEKAIIEMIKVVKKNHNILLIHTPNEATRQDWQGLHQWNFSEENGDFTISSKYNKINFSKKYESLCKTKCEYDNDSNLNTIIKKK